MRADSAVYRPARRNYSLLVVHNDMPRFLRCAHKMNDRFVFGKLEVHIYFHSPLVSMARKRVPGVAGIEFGHTHCKLTALAHVADNELIDSPLVDAFVCAQVALNAVLDSVGRRPALYGLYYFHRRICLVRRA